MFIEFADEVLLGTIIIAVGFWLSNLAQTAISRIYGEGSAAIANIARFAILGIVLAMANSPHASAELSEHTDSQLATESPPSHRSGPLEPGSNRS